MQKIIFILLGALLLVSFGCPGNETIPAEQTIQEKEVPEIFGPVECGEDFDCFVRASENCTPSHVMHTFNEDMSGMLISKEIYMEFQGMENKSCIYFQETKKQKIEFSKEFEEKMKSSNATEKEIQQAEDRTNENAKLYEGTKIICRLNPVQVHELINNWKEGKFSDADWKGKDCNITYSPAMKEKMSQKETVEPETEEEVSEEPVKEEMECIPVATEGQIELGVYEGDAKYYYEETEINYATKLEIGKSLKVNGGVKITLDSILINGTCGLCDAKPNWTEEQTAKITITVPHGAEHTEIAHIGEPGSFTSSYKCKTLDWDGKTCIEYVPEEKMQYYIWKISSEKTCISRKK